MTTEQLELNLSRVHEWIRAADQKASIFLALVLGGLALGGSEFISYTVATFDSKPTWLIVLLSTSTTILIWSVAKALLIIKPSVANNAKSFTYFGHVAQLTLPEYQKSIRKVSDKKYREELIEQTYTSSKIARKKHIQLAEAIQLFCSFVIVLAVLFGLAYVA